MIFSSRFSIFLRFITHCHDVDNDIHPLISTLWLHLFCPSHLVSLNEIFSFIIFNEILLALSLTPQNQQTLNNQLYTGNSILTNRDVTKCVHIFFTPKIVIHLISSEKKINNRFFDEIGLGVSKLHLTVLFWNAFVRKMHFVKFRAEKWIRTVLTCNWCVWWGLLCFFTELLILIGFIYFVQEINAVI